MNRQLPDVNVLVALLVPRHECYAAARAWFDKSGRQAWATNVLTHLGVLRLLTNPAFAQGAVNGMTAWDLLTRATQHPGHEFWTFDQETPTGLGLMAARVRGHQQWTDALLLWQAREKGGVLVTFDAGVKDLATGDFSGHLLVLKSR